MKKGYSGYMSLFGDITPAELAAIQQETNKRVRHDQEFQKRKSPANVGSIDGKK